MSQVRYAIIGVGGFGGVHLTAAEALEHEGLIKLCAVAEVFADRHKDKLDALRGRGVRVYTDHRDMLTKEPSIDIVSVPTPIHLHVPMTLACLERGCHVLLEKPPAVLVQDVDLLTRKAEQAGRLCQVGFQSTSDALARELKARLAEGEIGRVREIVVRGMWQRLDSYYARASWAGKLRVGDAWALDGPLNNPLCHYVHEALFLAGPMPHGTLRPVSVRAELYHAHPIEGEDIVCARAELEGGIVLHTYLTLCAPESQPTTVELVGEKGAAMWRPGYYELTGEAGRSEKQSEPGSTTALMRNLARAVNGGEELSSPLAVTRNVILHNNGCFKSSGHVRPVPGDKVRRYRPQKEGEVGDVATEVEGLPDIFERAARERLLFSEMGVEWAAETPTVEIDFDEFDPSPLLCAS